MSVDATENNSEGREELTTLTTLHDLVGSSKLTDQPNQSLSIAASYDLDSTAASIASGATTPALPDLTFPSRVQEAIQLKASGSDSQINSSDAVIIGIAVVDFNHLVGPQVEYAHPKELLEDEELCSNLPFLALPDGSHMVSIADMALLQERRPPLFYAKLKNFLKQSDEDFCYFHLVSKSLHNATIFGISCNRQIASSQLAVKGKEVTRSTVQKAVVVLARDVS